MPVNAAEHAPLAADEWTLVRDFRENEHGFVLPRYEAKCVDDVPQESIDDEVVLLKEVSSLGGKRVYHLPKDVFERTARRLPGEPPERS